MKLYKEKYCNAFWFFLSPEKYENKIGNYILNEGKQRASTNNKGLKGAGQDVNVIMGSNEDETFFESQSAHCLAPYTHNDTLIAKAFA